MSDTDLTDLAEPTAVDTEPAVADFGLDLSDEDVRLFASAFDASLGASPDADSDTDDGPPAAEADTPEPEPEPASEPPSALTQVLDELGLDPDDAANVLRWAQTAAQDPARFTHAPAEPVTAPQVAGQPAASGYGTPAPGPAPGAGMDSTATPVGQAGAPQRPDLTVLDDVIPGFSAYVTSLEAANQAAQERFALFEQQQRELAAAEAARQQATISQAIEVGVDRFREQYPDLNDQQFQRVMNTAAALQVMPQLAQKYGGDHVQATVEALNIAAWSDEQVRGALTQAQLNAFAAQQDATREKRGKAASLAGSGGSVPRNTPSAAPANMTPDQRQKALEAEIAAHLRGNV